MTELDGYVTEKIYMAVASGCIPIYYGKLDDYDKKIFNMNRVIMFDPTNEESLNNTFNKINELIKNPEKLYEFYKQKIFLDSAIDTINFYINNLDARLNEYII